MLFSFSKTQETPRSCLSDPWFKATGADGVVRGSLQRPWDENQGAELNGRHPRCKHHMVSAKGRCPGMDKTFGVGGFTSSKHDIPLHLLFSTLFWKCLIHWQPPWLCQTEGRGRQSNPRRSGSLSRGLKSQECGLWPDVLMSSTMCPGCVFGNSFHSSMQRALMVYAKSREKQPLLWAETGEWR